MSNLKLLVQENKKPVGRPKGNVNYIFCGFCLWQPEDNGKCSVCGRKITREPTYKNIIKRILSIYEENQDMIDQSLLLQIDKINLKIPVQLGFSGTYFLTLKDIINFYNIERTDQDQIEVYIEYLKKNRKKLEI